MKYLKRMLYVIVGTILELPLCTLQHVSYLLYGEPLMIRYGVFEKLLDRYEFFVDNYTQKIIDWAE